MRHLLIISIVIGTGIFNRYKFQSGLWYGMFRLTGSKPWFSRTMHLWMCDVQKLVGVWFWVNYHVRDMHVMMRSFSWTSILLRCPPAGFCMLCCCVYPWTVKFKSFCDILVKNCRLVRICCAFYHLGNNTLREHCWRESKHCQLCGQLQRSLPHTWLLPSSTQFTNLNWSGPSWNSSVVLKV
jgi:hypothetical protein